MPDTLPTTAALTPPWSFDAIRASGVPSAADVVVWLSTLGLDPTDVSDDELPSRICEAKDQQEAKSHKYGNTAIIILPLRSGNFALFGIDRDGLRILSPTELTADFIRDFALVQSHRIGTNIRHVERLRALGVEEPSDRQLARDIRRAARAPTPAEATASGISIDDL